MSVETPDRAVFGELERELVHAARRRNAAGAAGPVRHRRRAPRAAGVLVPALAAAITIAVVVVAVTSLGRSHRAPAPVPASGPPAAVIPVTARERANEQTARREASRLFELSAADLPAEIMPVSRDLSTPAQRGVETSPFFPGANQADLHSFWRVPGRPAAVIKWFESHPPQGWANSSTGSGGSGGNTLHWNVTFGFPTVPGRTSSEYLTFTTAAARGGGTAVRVDVQTIWVIPRPHDSIVPATVDEIEWSSATGSTSAVDHTFSSEANVRKLVGWLNAAPLLRFPAGNACFSGSPASGFRFTLFAAGRAQPVGTATWNGCGGVTLDIADHRYYLWLDTDQTAGNRLASAFMSGSVP